MGAPARLDVVWPLARSEPAVALYCRKVLIDAQPKDLLPEWLRFLKGVVDSEDLPLNISRETMQDRALIQKLNTVITKRFLKFLDEEAKGDADKYTEFLEYCNDRQWENNKFDFTITIKNDTLTQKGIEKIDSLGVNRVNIEKYVRIN